MKDTFAVASPPHILKIQSDLDASTSPKTYTQQYKMHHKELFTPSYEREDRSCKVVFCIQIVKIIALIARQWRLSFLFRVSVVGGGGSMDLIAAALPLRRILPCLVSEDTTDKIQF